MGDKLYVLLSFSNANLAALQRRCKYTTLPPNYCLIARFIMVTSTRLRCSVQFTSQFDEGSSSGGLCKTWPGADGEIGAAGGATGPACKPARSGAPAGGDFQTSYLDRYGCAHNDSSARFRRVEAPPRAHRCRSHRAAGGRSPGAQAFAECAKHAPVAAWPLLGCCLDGACRDASSGMRAAANRNLPGSPNPRAREPLKPATPSVSFLFLLSNLPAPSRVHLPSCRPY
jgi:hypothetical protein